VLQDPRILGLRSCHSQTTWIRCNFLASSFLGMEGDARPKLIIIIIIDFTLKIKFIFFFIVIIVIVNLIILIIKFNLSAQILIFFNLFLKNIWFFFNGNNFFFNLLMITINNNNNNNNNNSPVVVGQLHGSPGLGKRPSPVYLDLLQNHDVGQKRPGEWVCTHCAGLQTPSMRFSSTLVLVHTLPPGYATLACRSAAKRAG